MKLIGLGANLPSVAGSPRETCRAALRLLPERGVSVLRTSRWYETAPVPASGQPNFVNAVAVVETALAAGDLLAVLHDLEARFGRQRSVPNAARTLDLDLLDFDGAVDAIGPVRLPHPRLADRAFVLCPLQDAAPGWRHPVLGKSAAELIAGLPQTPEKMGVWPIPEGS